MNRLKQIANKFLPDRQSAIPRPFLQSYNVASRYTEAFRTLRANIQFSFTDKKYKSILITSAGQGEGKTSTAMNLAYTMALAGKKVLVLDTDLRKPVMSDIIKPGKTLPGITGLVTSVFGMDIAEGMLAEFSVSDLLRLASFQKKTGILKLSGDSGGKLELFFFQGGLTDISWPARPDHQKLAKMLIRENLITKEQAKLAFEQQKHTGQKLAVVLLTMGLLSEDDLRMPLTLHMLEGLRTALHMDAGEFRFTDIAESDFARPSFNPVDFIHLYNQVVIGEEDLPFLQAKITSAIEATDTENLFLLSSGPNPANPSEILASERMSFLISYLKKRFDVLIFDSPPMLPASDALILSSQVDGVLLVVKAGMLKGKLVRSSVDQLRIAQANLMGVALNQVNVKDRYYGNYYTDYYDYYS